MPVGVRKDHGGFRGRDLKALIQGAYPALPVNQRKVADFLLRHLTEAPFLSVADVERRSGASKATVVRLARSLGFSGFQEMRSRLLEGVQTMIRVRDPFPLPERRRGSAPSGWRSRAPQCTHGTPGETSRRLPGKQGGRAH